MVILFLFRNITLFQQDCTPTFADEELNAHYNLMYGNYQDAISDINNYDPDHIVIMSNYYDHLRVYELMKEKEYKMVR